jgi:hypothetical protein
MKLRLTPFFRNCARRSIGETLRSSQADSRNFGRSTQVNVGDGFQPFRRVCAADTHESIQAGRDRHRRRGRHHHPTLGQDLGPKVGKKGRAALVQAPNVLIRRQV